MVFLVFYRRETQIGIHTYPSKEIGQRTAIKWIEEVKQRFPGQRHHYCELWAPEYRLALKDTEGQMQPCKIEGIYEMISRISNGSNTRQYAIKMTFMVVAYRVV